MGGGNYDQDVSQERDDFANEAFQNHGYHSGAENAIRNEPDPLVDPKGRVRECFDSDDKPETTPIVVVLDSTASRGADMVIFYQKLPLLIGEVIARNYVKNPSLSIAAIGDATDGDKVPIQVGQFESDSRLDEVLKAIYLEKGGGGTGFESYELAAFFYARRSRLHSMIKRHKKGKIFFAADEQAYPNVSKEQVKQYLGVDIPADIPTVKIFQELQKLYDVYIIFPKQTWEQRKDQIDDEMKRRLDEAGGRYANVDIRASLLWNTYDDLDLHCITPSGEEIFYGHKDSRCGGSLDVDRNARGKETRKPVENIRWPQGSAPKGKYRVYVQNYAYHEDERADIPFTVEIEINGKIQTFTKVMPNGSEGRRSDMEIFSFDYDPNARVTDTARYANYDDEMIKREWAKLIPPEHILIIDDPKAIVDIILGVLAITSGTSLQEYTTVHMGARNQLPDRQKEVTKALSDLSNSALTVVETGTLPGGGSKRKGGTKRLT